MKNSIKRVLPLEKSVTLREFSRSPSRCFEDVPVAVLAKGHPVGYLLSPELFKDLIFLMAQTKDPVLLKKELNLSDAWLEKFLGAVDV
ncbi:MAG: antitoxin of toxin-antitoxin stability system [Rhodopirellula sp.]|nr:antitoxin of toxin-antitoxin stability system [Rhodopirellula sp.]